MSGKTSKEGYWDELYQQNQIGWDIGYPSPAIKDYIDQLTDKSIVILIPGCGNAYEAEYLLAQGFTNVTLIDISPTLTEQLSNKFKGIREISIITGDFFDHDGKYDLIIEQTFLSALDPALRPAYVKKNHALLTKGGHMAGVLFGKHFEDNPLTVAPKKNIVKCSKIFLRSRHWNPATIQSTDDKVQKYLSISSQNNRLWILTISKTMSSFVA